MPSSFVGANTDRHTKTALCDIDVVVHDVGKTKLEFCTCLDSYSFTSPIEI